MYLNEFISNRLRTRTIRAFDVFNDLNAPSNGRFFTLYPQSKRFAKKKKYISSNQYLVNTTDKKKKIQQRDQMKISQKVNKTYFCRVLFDKNVF